ncbi:MAG TPA: hypothetical protein VFN70_18140 [Burkholderiales bacterium]|nr:hypothetical protein [Burkholderiales bacterium]
MRALLAVSLLAGCAARVDPPLERLPLVAPRIAVTVHGDTRFTPEERAACETAARKWVRFANGNASLNIVWDVDEFTFMDRPLPLLYRSDRTPETGYMGGVTSGQVVRIVPETCAAHASVEACALHEFGHLLGLEHFENVRGQVMSTCDGTPSSRGTGCGPASVFGVADHAECVRVGVCSRPKNDVTTVTVTIDPAVPPAEPVYP